MAHNSARIALLEGSPVNIAPLETIDFSRIATKEPAEAAKLLKAAQSDGFFYLDLQNDVADLMLAERRNIVHIMEKYFDQPFEVKMKDDRGLPNCG